MICDEYSPAAFEKLDADYPPSGWTQFTDDVSITDVCPSCLTDDEHVDRVISHAMAEVEADFLGPIAEPDPGAYGA